MASEPLRLGCWLSSEELPPADLVRVAVAAEAAGFDDAMISDHFHPWIPAQGQAGFVWATLGAIAQATTRLRLATGVTAPIIRMHPVVVAHAASTVASLMPGRFSLGLGSGERLNEHVTGERWPRAGVRRAMLAEAIGIIRELLAGDVVNHDGDHFRVEHAQLFTRADTPPPILIAAGGRRSAQLAGEHADGLIALQPVGKLVEQFERAGGAGKPRVGQLHVCWAKSERDARATARRWWPNGALPPAVLSELAQPSDFRSLSELVTDDAVGRAVMCGPDPDAHLRAIARFAAAGFTLVQVHQVGPDQDGFLRFYEREIFPRVASVARSA